MIGTEIFSRSAYEVGSRKKLLLQHFYFSRPRLFVIFLLVFTCCAGVMGQENRQHQKLREFKVEVTDDGSVQVSAFKAIRFYEDKFSHLFPAIKIYRKYCCDFTFNTDYEEYFNDLRHEDAMLLYDGPIVPLLNSKFVYTDRTARTDSVYAYWISTVENVPLGPLAVKVRDQRVWWTNDFLARQINRLKEEYPGLVYEEEIGKTVERNTITGIRVGKGRPAVGLVGAIHGGESGPEIIVDVIDRLLKHHQGLLERNSIVVIPSINVDSRIRMTKGNPWYIRKNANQVDLNRNFPSWWREISTTYNYYNNDPDGLTYKGPYPASEPETEAVIKFLRRNKPKVLFSFHHLASIAGEVLLASSKASSDENYKQSAAAFAKLYWEGMDSPGKASREVQYKGTAGSLTSWCYEQLGIPAFDVEGPTDQEDSGQSVKDLTTEVLLRKYQQKHFNGLLRLLESFD